VKSKEDEFFDPMGITFDIDKSDRQKNNIASFNKMETTENIIVPLTTFFKIC